MKSIAIKTVAAVALTAANVLMNLGGQAQAVTYPDRYTGLLMGNVCRSGLLWATGPFNPVGSSCFIPSTNTWGVISAE